MNVPTVFVLEDDPERQKQFRHRLLGANLTTVADVESAKSALEKAKFQVIFLDHDLGGKAMAPSDPDGDNGYALARWMVERLAGGYMQPPLVIVVHTLNPIGGDNIMGALAAVCTDMNIALIRLPFAWTRVSINEGEITINSR